MADNLLKKAANELVVPIQSIKSVVPNDTTDIDVCRALYVGTGGNISLISRNDTTAVVLKNVPDGTILPIMTKRVLSTNTTATDILALS